MMSYSATECCLHPLREVHAGISAWFLYQTQQAFVCRLGGKMTEGVLERIGNPSVIEPDVGRALVMEDVITHYFFEQAVEFTVVAEDHVSAEVPPEALWVDDRSRMTSGDRSTFKHEPVFVT